jgi:hypothetical protein
MLRQLPWAPETLPSRPVGGPEGIRSLLVPSRYQRKNNDQGPDKSELKAFPNR